MHGLEIVVNMSVCGKMVPDFGKMVPDFKKWSLAWLPSIPHL
jgi:hypothetical protein